MSHYHLPVTAYTKPSSAGRSFVLVLVLLIITLNFSDSTRVYPSQSQSLSITTRDAWPTFRHDVGRAGFTNGSAPHTPELLWKFSTNGTLKSSPVISGGRVYFASGDGFAYAVNESTGQLIWRVPVGYVTTATPSLYDNALYVASDGSSRLFSLDPASGSVRWSVGVGNVLNDLLTAEGKVFVADNEVSNPGGHLYAINASTGSQIWRRSINETSDFAYSGGLLYLGSADPADGGLYALNASNGVTVWSARTPNAVFSGPSVYGGILYMLAVNLSRGPSQLVAFNSSSGNVIWKAHAEGGTPAIAYGGLYLTGALGLVALRQIDGASLWYFPFRGGGGSLSTPAIADGEVIVGGGGENWPPDPTIYGVNASNGRMIWNFSVGIAANTSPAIADGAIFVGAQDGVLYALTQTNPNTLMASPNLILLLFASAFSIAASAVILYWVLRLKRTLHPPQDSKSTRWQHSRPTY